MNFFFPRFFFSRAPFQLGVQRYALFFNFQIFSQKFFIFHLQRQSFQELLTLAGHPFFKWECKGSAFFLTSKLFFEKFHLFAFLGKK
jgi:hypothetical protein